MGRLKLIPERSLFVWILCPLWLLALLGAHTSQETFTLPARADALDANCETTYAGITYCVEDDGELHIVIIDLSAPYIRFEMVMADDVDRTDTEHREQIEEMVTRLPYRDQNVVVAINADYFGHTHGPEGLTVKNGERLDGGATGYNPHALWRSSLAISRLNRVSLGRKTIAELETPAVYRERFYNAVGGGPLILNQGIVIPNRLACLLEQFPVGACRRTIQTAAGLSQDGRWLYLAAGQGRDIEGLAQLLREYGAFTAIKLDGGGSSQLWYNGQIRHDTNRPVGNALLVFYSPVPYHDARYTRLPNFPVAEPGERVEVQFEIQNTGFLDWAPDLGYRLQNVQGWPLLGPAYHKLSVPVPAGGSVVPSLVITAPQRPGVYEAAWQMTRRAEAIGPRVWFGLIVVPPQPAGAPLQERLQAQLDSQRARPGFLQDWPALRQMLEATIQHETKTTLRQTWRDAEAPPYLPTVSALWTWWAPLLQSLPY